MKLDNHRMRQLLNAGEWQDALRLLAEVNSLPELEYPLSIRFIEAEESGDFDVSLYYAGHYYDWAPDSGGFWGPWPANVPVGPHAICRLPAGWKKEEP